MGEDKEYFKDLRFDDPPAKPEEPKKDDEEPKKDDGSKKGDDTKKDDGTQKGDDTKKDDGDKKDDDTEKPVQTKHTPVPKDKRTPAKAAEIATIQDNGSLQLNLAQDTRASKFYGKEGLKPSLIVDKKLFPKKDASLGFEASQLP